MTELSEDACPAFELTSGVDMTSVFYILYSHMFT